MPSRNDPSGVHEDKRVDDMLINAYEQVLGAIMRMVAVKQLAPPVHSAKTPPEEGSYTRNHKDK
jgi:hypothetical protein